MENKLEDFTEGSEWVTIKGYKVKFHSFDEKDGLPLFVCESDHPYSEDVKGTIGWVNAWKIFSKYSD